MERRKLQQLADQDEKRALAVLAVGRLLRLMSRPFQEGDLEQYEECREVLLNVSGKE
jgi:hypothetical protein